MKQHGFFRWIAPAISVCILSVCALPLQATFLANGSFENPIVGAGSFSNFADGSTLITGWTVVGGGGVSVIDGAVVLGCCTLPSQDLAQWLDLTGAGFNGTEGVEQSVSTVIGNLYTLSFYVGNINNPVNGLGTQSATQVFLGGLAGTSLGTFTNVNPNSTTLTWQLFTVDFTATGSTTVIDFINMDPLSDGLNGLDNVTLTTSSPGVPEPGTWVFLLSGLSGLLIANKRRLSR